MSLVVGTNSWITVNEADTYFSTRLGISTTWSALSDLDKESALITAFNWLHYDQTFNVPVSATAQGVKNAQAEAALFLLRYQETYEKRESLIASGVTSFSYGDKWEEDISQVKKPQIVMDMLASADYGLANVLEDVTVNDEDCT